MNEEKMKSSEELQQETVSEAEETAAPVMEDELHSEAPAEQEVIQQESESEVPVQEQDADVNAEEAAAAEADASAQEEAAPAEEPSEQPSGVVYYHDRYYLRYHEGKRTSPMDLQGTRSFLQTIGFDGGALRQAREGTGYSEIFRNAEKSGGSQVYCSYCGTEISGVEFYHLPDGRVRCTGCSNSQIKTKAEAEALCARVIANMEKFFGASINVHVKVEMMDELKLKRKSGIPLGTKDAQSVLILGVAINKKNDYTIYLENGAPRIAVIATFAHELTHIWQYTHWDVNKGLRQCSAANRLVIYEGMAKWAEIQYLYLVGETNVAKREEYITRKREDPYGIGFRLYEEYYPLTRDTMNCGSTPFTPNKYPFT